MKLKLHGVVALMTLVLSATFISVPSSFAVPPANPTISSTFARVAGVDVSFTPVTGLTYQVKVSAAGAQVAASNAGLTNSPIAVNGLTANTDYSVELIATNSGGEFSSTTTTVKTYQSIRLDFQYTSATL